jgi:acyl-CoA thioester hydrolase
MTPTPVFTLVFKVAESDIDPQGHINNVAFVRYVQDVAVAHWRAAAPEDLRTAFTWVVRRHEVEYLRPGLPGDELTIRTWVGTPAGATWERFTEVFRTGEDKPIATARTVWVLLDAATNRPRRVDADFVARFTNGMLAAGE